MLEAGQETLKMSELKKMWFKGKVFYVDPKLQELRSVQNPHEVFSFEEYCELRREAVGLGCGTCQLHSKCEI